MQNNIHTIFFDLFGVLLGVDQSVVIQYLSKLTGTTYLQTREITMGEAFMRLERGEIKFKEYVENIQEFMPNGNLIESDSLRDIWINSNIGEMPAVSLVADLLKNYNVWVISNTTESHIRKLKTQFTFLEKFNGIVSSQRAEYHKPHPNIFKFAFKEAHCERGNSLFIDDSQSNIDTAEALGIASHHYTDFEGLVQFFDSKLSI
tara:strand:- start:32 stop:643 length:612 start_codon:yes stop_codon:yes gene_type:complete